jgi:protein tyrosine phosphatase (PTP) superfamily phosphohydrolase (DUF442 family)
MDSIQPTATSSKPRKLRRSVVALVALAGLGVAGYFFWTQVVESNFAVVVPGQVYRSGQPSMDQLRTWVRQYDIKTVINLRGDKLDICKQEQAVAAEMKVKEIPIALGAHRLVSRARLAALIEALDQAPRPLLLHCYYGNDRAGLAAMLAVLAGGKSDYATARKQLRVPLARWGKNKTHISDTIVMYEGYCREKDLDPNSWPQFKQWALETYSPDAGRVEDPQQAE